MKIALFFTVYNRPQYLEPVLESWMRVRGFYDTPVYVLIEPSPVQHKVYELLALTEHPNMRIHLNSKVEGVLHNPWLGFEKLFGEGYDFVIRAEDDLLVATDTLEFMSWAAGEYQIDPAIGIVTAFYREFGALDGATYELGLGSPWIIGTWVDRWKNLIGPTWDHDYSTGEGRFRGWDHNLHHRIFPKYGLHAIMPTYSRVVNIGAEGTHAQPSSFQLVEPETMDIPPQTYREVLA